MAGMIKGSPMWTQRMIGAMTRDLERIHRYHPEADEWLKRLIKDMGQYIDITLASDHEPERSIVDVWMEKIFS